MNTRVDTYSFREQKRQLTFSRWLVWWSQVSPTAKLRDVWASSGEKTLSRLIVKDKRGLTLVYCLHTIDTHYCYLLLLHHRRRRRRRFLFLLPFILFDSSFFLFFFPLLTLLFSFSSPFFPNFSFSAAELSSFFFSFAFFPFICALFFFKSNRFRPPFQTDLMKKITYILK